MIFNNQTNITRSGNYQNDYIKISTYIYLITNLKTVFYIFLPLILLISKFINYTIFCIEDRDKINIIYSKIKNDFALKYDEDYVPHGLVINKKLFPKYILFNGMYKYDPIYIFITRDNLDIILKDNKKSGIINLKKIKNNNKKNKKKETKEIKYLMKRGWYGNIHFRTRDILIKNNSFNWKQEILYENIMKFYNKNNYSKIFISGDIGKGKTYFSYLLAKYLNCFLCDTFDPTEPSCTLDNIYTSIDHSYKKPLILLIDEIDIIFEKITKQEPLHHKKFSIMIKNKIDWNNFLDKIEFGLYKNLILIICSNMTKEEIAKKYDKSFLRKGRINVFSTF